MGPMIITYPLFKSADIIQKTMIRSSYTTNVYIYWRVFFLFYSSNGFISIQPACAVYWSETME